MKSLKRRNIRRTNKNGLKSTIFAYEAENISGSFTSVCITTICILFVHKITFIWPLKKLQKPVASRKRK